MKIFFLQRTAAIAILLFTVALPVFAGQLDDYYLSAFGEQTGSGMEKAVLFKAADTGEPAHCGTPLKHGLSRDWNQLESATQKILAKQLALPTLSGEQILQSTHFRIHYATSGSNTPTPASGYTLAQWVQQVADAFEYAYTYYQGKGYHMPPTNPYDVYLITLTGARMYGQTTDIQKVPSSGFPYASSSFIEIDKDFTGSIFVNAKNGPYTSLQSLQITAAHEFHHAIQYGYNYYFDVWYAEAASTWYEDEVRDDVNQLYNYLSTWFASSTVSLDKSDGYDRWIFNRYLAENHSGDAVIKSFWEALASTAPTGTQDIPMLPVMSSTLGGTTLGTDFFNFAKRAYTRNWSTHTADIGKIPTYSPASKNSDTVTLPHYSFYYNKFPSSSTTQTITLSKTSGIQAALFKKTGSTITEIQPNSTGTSYTASAADEVVLLIANTTATDNHQASFSLNGSSQSLTEPTGGTTSSTTTTTTTGTTTGTTSSTTAAASNSTGTNSSGSKLGCFIATAAYGSYLHPNVQLLRDFRDHYLLTNEPGRIFVAIYYRLSPQFADVIAQHEMLRLLARLLLTPLVLMVAYPASFMTFFFLTAASVTLILRRRRAMAAIQQR